MILKLLIILAFFLGVFLIYIARQPSEYKISRELMVNARAEVIFPFINDSKKMDSWNPWMELDPAVKVIFSGPESGVGAVTSWEGGEKLGTGSATVIESIPNTLVKTRLEYVKPYPMTQEAEISLQSEGSQTLVRWSVTGHNVFLGRLMCFFMNMDEMIGGTFEKGLKNLKSKVEG